MKFKFSVHEFKVLLDRGHTCSLMNALWPRWQNLGRGLSSHDRGCMECRAGNVSVCLFAEKRCHACSEPLRIKPKTVIFASSKIQCRIHQISAATVITYLWQSTTVKFRNNSP